MKILVVEDDPVTRRLLETFLEKWGYDVLTITDGRRAWEVLQTSKAPRLVVSDWMMPHMNGVELCKKIRASERSDYTYFILLTTKGQKEDIIEGLEAGADDFVIKPFDSNELKYRVRIGARIVRLEQRIRRLANTDHLTGLFNRRVFIERVEQEIQKSRRQNIPLGLIMVDIDHFKKINDSYGHQVGDLVLKKFADLLTSSSRPYDLVARYGGEEFVACLPGADNLQTESVAERMRAKVEKLKIMLPDRSQTIRITASFGTASFRPDSEINIDMLINKADKALYQAKEQGRNCVCSG